MSRFTLHRLVLLFAMMSISTGCQYARHQTRDLADVFTLTATEGWGVEVTAVYPIGIGDEQSIWGLEDGALIGSEKGAERMNRVIFSDRDTDDRRAILAPRNKHYDDSYMLVFFPFDLFDTDDYSSHNYGKLELSLGAGYGLRAGINVLEVFDLLTGLIMLDPLRDNLADEDENRAMPEIATPPEDKQADQMEGAE